MKKHKEKKTNKILSRITLSSSTKDLLIILILSFLVFILASKYHVFEQLHEISRQYEDMELDEIFTLLMILSIALSIFSLRRMFELKHEIKERKLAEKKITELAYIDSLTGLANRTLLKDRLLHIMAHAKRQKTKLAILFIDLDGFKIINDTLGHKYGDDVLKNVAQRMLGAVRDIDTVARIGGDEFIVVLESIRELNEINHISQRVLEALCKEHQFAEHKVNATPSIGISIFPDDGDTCEVLINNADTAMYECKTNGKAQLRFYNKDLILSD